MVFLKKTLHLFARNVISYCAFLLTASADIKE